MGNAIYAIKLGDYVSKTRTFGFLKKQLLGSCFYREVLSELITGTQLYEGKEAHIYFQSHNALIVRNVKGKHTTRFSRKK